jgi:hypothetical protein
MKLIITLIIFFSFSLISFSSTYFVSNDGKNSNIGNFSNPLLTIQEAINRSKSGDSILIRNGIYRESVIINKINNIYISSYNNEYVRISPFVPNLNYEWENYKDKIYRTKIKDSIIQLFIDDSPSMTASYPTINEGMFDLSHAKSITSFGNKTINFPGISIVSDLKNARFVGLCSDNIVSIGGRVIQKNGDIISISDSAFYWQDAFQKTYLDKGKGFLTGKLEFLDNQNEWFWENGYLYLYTNNIESSKLKKIELRSDKFGIDISNSKNIVLKNLTFFGGSVIIKNSQNCLISNATILYPTPFFHFLSGFEIYQQIWDGVQVIEEGPEKWKGKGVEIGGINNKIYNCYIAHSWGDGLTVYGENNMIENCFVEDCDWMATDNAPLNISGKNHVVIHNTFRNTARSVIVHRKLENSLIQYNNIYNGGLLCDDLGLTYCYNTDSKNTVIGYNWVHDNFAKNNGVGIYLDENNSNTNIHNNVTWNCTVGINLNKPCKNTTVYNNTLYSNKYSMGAWGNTGQLENVYTFNNLTDSDLSLSWNYNSFYGTKQDSNYLYKNNPFTDPNNNNFELKANAYPIDKGIKNKYTLDYVDKPDLGAYEFGKESWTPGAKLTIPCIENERPFSAYDLSVEFNTKDTTFLKWTYYSSGIDTFLIERRKSEEENFQTIGYTSKTVFNYYDTTKNLFGSYIYQVRAKNKFGISEPTNSIKVFKSNYSQAIVLEAERNDDYNGITLSKDQISNCDNLNYIAFKQIDLENGYDACIIRYAVPCEYAFQNVQIRLDNENGKIIGQYITLPTGGWDNFDTISIPITAVKGIHDIYFVFKGEFGVGTFDWFTFIKSNKTILSARINTDTNCIQTIKKQKTIPVKLFPNPGYGDLRVSFLNKETLDVGIEIYSYEGFLIFKKEYQERKEGEVEIYLNEELFDSYKQHGMFLIKVTLNNSKRSQETILKYIRI